MQTIPAQKSVILGEDPDTHDLIAIGDIERCGGLYVLGKPRTGKSHLLENLALQDIKNGHGLLFIDPHSDAINDILVRLPPQRQQNVILLDPTDETYSFGINLLSCPNPNSLRERNITFSQAMDVFVKLFGDTQTGDLRILLSTYLRNSFYPMIENQGYTLADLPMFLTDKQFRDHLLKNVSFNREVVHFWHNEFERLPKKDQIADVQSTLRRLNPFLTHEYTKHIISQPKTTIDFGWCMDTRKIVLLRLPIWLTDELKTFIGTTLLSQLLKAVFLRADSPQQERIFFALYCDEFQNFSTPDFAKLFTQTGKFNIMPTVAHQERVGQFKPDDPNRGATLAAPNKVLFSLTVHDSDELAPEFTKPSPTEIRLDRQLGITQEPFKDLLAGHIHPEIHRFVQQYLRPLHYQLEDTQEDMESVRLLRQALLDEAAFSRGEERREGFFNAQRARAGASISFAALERTQQAMEVAKSHTATMLSLYDSARNLKLSIRSLNTFLTAIMEGRVVPEPGQELFSHFLLAFVPLAVPVPLLSRRAFALYVSLLYGNPHLSRPIPVFLAAKYQLASPEEICREIDEKYKQKVMAYCERERMERDEERAAEWRDRHERVTKKIFTWKRRQSAFDFILSEVRGLYQLLEDRAVRMLLTPYFTATFAPPWYYDPKHVLSRRSDEAPPDENERALVFLRQFGEGAWVTFSLLMTGLSGWQWNSQIPTLGTAVDDLRSFYPNRHMLEIPAITGKEPFAVWQLIKQLNATLLEIGEREDRFYARDWWPNAQFWHNPEVGHYELMKLDPYGWYAGKYRTKSFAREDGILLSEALHKIGERATPGNWWSTLDEQTQYYLIFRACDLVTYGPIVADRTFPQPTLQGISPQQVSVAVTALMMLLLKTQEESKARWEQGWVRQKADFFEEVWWKNDGLLHYSLYKEVHGLSTYDAVASYLPPRVLSAAEIETLKAACLKELHQSDTETQGNSEHGVFAALDAFVQFCRLLRRPENHIKGQTAQYVEREVNTYSTDEMTNQMVRELINLPRFTAYAKVIQEQAGTQVVLQQKIQTKKLPPVQGKNLLVIGDIVQQFAIHSLILRKRDTIEEELRQRQEKWRKGIASDKPPPSHTKGTSAVVEEPPPSHVSLKKPPAEKQSGSGKDVKQGER